MEWDTFVENAKIFWNQPLTIILFVIVVVIIGFLFIFSKTSLGKKALNKLKALYNDLKSRYEYILEVIRVMRNEFQEFKAEKEKQIVELTDAYELKWNQYKEFAMKQDEMIKVICENSPNKHIKEAYEKYSHTDFDLPVNEIADKIREEVGKDYADRIKALEEKIYGKAEETKDNQTTSE